MDMRRPVHSAVNHYDNSRRKTITQACKNVGLAVVPPPKSRAPKRNGMALPADMRQRIEDIARSGLYTNPSQIGKALREAGISVSDNTVRNNLEAAGFYKYRSVTGSDGKPIKKKVILR